MARGKVRAYADGRLVEMLAGGEYSYAKIAKAVGLTEGYVGRVARGERRPRVMVEVRARAAAVVEEARRVAARCSRELVAKHVEVGLAGDGETGRKCREFILCMCGLGPDGEGWHLQLAPPGARRARRDRGACGCARAQGERGGGGGRGGSSAGRAHPQPPSRLHRDSG